MAVKIAKEAAAKRNRVRGVAEGTGIRQKRKAWNVSREF
jgi:hypothetical protein